MGNQLIFTEENKQIGLELFNMFLRFCFVVVMFFVNFLSLAISLNCNREKGIGTKLFVGIYAFLFGFIYLFVNYYSVRLMSKGESCEFSTTNPFPL